MNKGFEFETPDLGLCTALVVKGCSLDSIRPVGNRRAVFVLSWRDEIPEWEKQYWSGKLAVSALEFHQQTKFIKSRLYGQQNL
jgi:hypothetical protein